MPWPFMLEKGDVGSINLGSMTFRVNELMVNNITFAPYGRSPNNFSEGPYTLMNDALQITESWELTAQRAGSPGAFDVRTDIRKMVEVGQTEANPTRFTYLGSSYTVGLNRLLVQENANPTNTFKVEFTIIAGSPRA